MKKSKSVKRLYHATCLNNIPSILDQGLKKSPFEGGVYLTDSEESAVRWVLVRGIQNIVVIGVDVEEEKLQPGVDHSPLMQELFGCGESYLHQGDIDVVNLKTYTSYGGD
jgi:hypothetical protein